MAIHNPNLQELRNLNRKSKTKTYYAFVYAGGKNTTWGNTNMTAGDVVPFANKTLRDDFVNIYDRSNLVGNKMIDAVTVNDLYYMGYGRTKLAEINDENNYENGTIDYQYLIKKLS